MTAAPTFLPAPIPELLKRLKTEPALSPGHKDITVARAPGRLDIIGAMSDYTGALACQMPLDAAAAVAVQRRDDRRLLLKNYTSDAAGNPHTDFLELSLDDFYGTAALLPDATLQQIFAGKNHWAASIAGAYPVLARHKKFTRRTHGANIACYSAVPTAGGTGSTSAVAAATLSALTAAYHLILDPLEIAVLTQQIQHHIVGLPGGSSDAAASVLGKKDQLVLFSGQSHRLQANLPVPAGFLFAGIHTGSLGIAPAQALCDLRTSASIAQTIITRMYKDMGLKKDPTGGCLAAVPLPLFQKYVRPILPESIDGKTFLDAWGPLTDRGSTLDPAATYTPRAAADYHISENLRAHQFVEHLKMLGSNPAPGSAIQSATAAGALLFESYRSASDSAHLPSSSADILIELLQSRGPAQGFFGARPNGGTLALFAADTSATREALSEICDTFQKRTGSAARLLAASSPGAAEAPPLKFLLADL